MVNNQSPIFVFGDKISLLEADTEIETPIPFINSISCYNYQSRCIITGNSAALVYDIKNHSISKFLKKEKYPLIQYVIPYTLYIFKRPSHSTNLINLVTVIYHTSFFLLSEKASDEIMRWNIDEPSKYSKFKLEGEFPPYLHASNIIHLEHSIVGIVSLQTWKKLFSFDISSMKSLSKYSLDATRFVGFD